MKATGAWLRRIQPRSDLRRALLAGGETCWVYAAAALVRPAGGGQRLISPLGIWLAYWAALEIGHYLPRLRRSWRSLQWLNLGLAVLLALVILRLDLYRDAPLFDFSWLSEFGRELFDARRFLTPAQIAVLALFYVYLRGIGFGQRPLTLWFVGFQFRLGVLIFFFICLADSLTRSVNLLLPLLAFFALSLLSVSLARIDESGRTQGMGWRWAALLLGATALVILLAVSVTPLFTLAGAGLAFQLLTPLLPVLLFVLSLVLIPLGWLISGLIALLAPLFKGLSEVFRSFNLATDSPLTNPFKGIPQALDQLAWLIPYLRLAALIGVVLGMGWIVARALNRRMMQVEAETYAREAAEPQGTVPLKPSRRTPAVRPGRARIEAENVRRIYAALLAHTAALGLPRREAETPLEFLPRLVERFPRAQAGLREITAAYVAVHYGEEPATTTRVRELRSTWTQVRRDLSQAARHKGEG